MFFVGSGHRRGDRAMRGEVRVLRATLNRPSASTPGWLHFDQVAQGAGGSFEHLIAIATRQLGRRALFVVINLLVAGVVMSLPFIASNASRSDAQTLGASAAIGSTSVAPVDGMPDVARAVLQSRGQTIAAGRNPVTLTAEGVRSVQEYTLSAKDTLWTIANYYGLSAEAVAFANGIKDPYHLPAGKKIVIPPQEGALYTVAAGDTVASVAARFKVDPTVITDDNRLYYGEPEHFVAGQVVFVARAALPTLPPPPEPVFTSAVIARAAAPAPSAQTTGYLAWPVNGIITQYMWAGHTGVDIAAPYGTGLAASVSGVISENGWVAIGGLHICVRSGTLEECYFHMSAAYDSVGTAVTAGQIIGAIGLTGVTTGPHVHWETKINGQFENPLTVQP
jgi:murein DD-endopeptidase MepM/ murein hydrolase activator NlpD